MKVLPLYCPKSVGSGEGGGNSNLSKVNVEKILQVSSSCFWFIVCVEHYEPGHHEVARVSLGFWESFFLHKYV